LRWRRLVCGRDTVAAYVIFLVSHMTITICMPYADECFLGEFDDQCIVQTSDEAPPRGRRNAPVN
jgi:hypothetical protein